jgi:hypothetical protein
MMVVAGWLALQLRSALDTFQILLQVGAGTGLIFLLRWYWWRINAYSEISAMISSFAIAVTFKVLDTDLAWWQELLTGVGLTTLVWVTVTLFSPNTDQSVLESFFRKVRPGGPGWKRVRSQIPETLPASDALGPQLTSLIMGIATVYGFLFGIGRLIYGELLFGIVLVVVATGLAYVLVTKEASRQSQ